MTGKLQSSQDFWRAEKVPRAIFCRLSEPNWVEVKLVSRPCLAWEVITNSATDLAMSGTLPSPFIFSGSWCTPIWCRRIRAVRWRPFVQPLLLPPARRTTSKTRFHALRRVFSPFCRQNQAGRRTPATKPRVLSQPSQTARIWASVPSGLLLFPVS